MFTSIARVAAFAVSKETGIAVAAILGTTAPLVTALCKGAAEIIKAVNDTKKAE